MKQTGMTAIILIVLLAGAAASRAPTKSASPGSSFRKVDIMSDSPDASLGLVEEASKTSHNHPGRRVSFRDPCGNPDDKAGFVLVQDNATSGKWEPFVNERTVEPFPHPYTVEPKHFPTGFFWIGCMRDTQSAQIRWYHEHIPKEDRKPMNPEVCFDFCRNVTGALFFGLKGGDKCYCTPFTHNTDKGGHGFCEAPCEGDYGVTCGGLDSPTAKHSTMIDVYEMNDCNNLPALKCQRPPAPVKHATMWKSSYYRPTTICSNAMREPVTNKKPHCNVMCDYGYTLIHNDIQCIERGNRLTYSWAEFSGSAVCQCNMCPQPPVGEGTLPAVPNFPVCYPNTVLYQCLHGYSTRPNMSNATGPKNFTLSCRGDGTYSDMEKCEPVHCGTCPKHPHSIPREQTMRVYEDVCTYDCDKGYTLDQNAAGAKVWEAKCHASGTFTAMYRCLPVKCPGQRHVEHAEIVSPDASSLESVEFPLTIGYRCMPGYTRDAKVGGRNSFQRDCQADGLLSLPKAESIKGGKVSGICLPVSCGKPPNADHADYPKVEFYYKEKAYYTCNLGYTLDAQPDGPEMEALTCQKDGTYDRPAPVCKPVECGPAPRHFASVTVRSPPAMINYESAAIQYQCGAGFSTDRGDDPYKARKDFYSIACTARGNFSVYEPCVNIDNCIYNSCGDFGRCVDLKDPTGVVIDDYDCKCQPGYETTLHPMTPKLDEKVCTNINDCPRPDPYTEFPCGGLNRFNQSRGDCHDVVLGYYCTCNVGYEVKNMSDLPQNETCKPVVCGAVPEPNHTTNDFGDKEATYDSIPWNYTCDKGYTTTGQYPGPVLYHMSCTSEATFDPSSPPPCLPVSCGNAPVLMHSSSPIQEQEMFYPQENSYICDVGYTLDAKADGEVTYDIKCLHNSNYSILDNEYSVRYPTLCKAVECGTPTIVEKAHADLLQVGMTFFYDGVNAKQHCDHGYSLDGSMSPAMKQFEQECLADGTFADPPEPGKCQPVKCPMIVPNPNMVCDMDPKVYKEEAECVANNGYTLDGQPGGKTSFTCLCQANATFTPVKKVYPVTCGPAPNMTAEFAVGPSAALVFPNSASYNCMAGYSVDGDKDGVKSFWRTCQADGTYTPHDGCKPVSCGAWNDIAHTEQIAGPDGKKLRELVFPEVAVFKCDPGWSNDGILNSTNTNGSIICQASGEPFYPDICQKNEDDCSGAGNGCAPNGLCVDFADPTGVHWNDFACLCNSGYQPELVNGAKTCTNIENCPVKGEVNQGTQKCSTDMFGIDFCGTWCNTAGKWGCGVSSLVGSDPRNTANATYTCACAGCNGCRDSADFNQTACLPGTCTDLVNDYSCTCPPGYYVGAGDGIPHDCLPVSCGEPRGIDHCDRNSTAKVFYTDPPVAYSCHKGYTITGIAGGQKNFTSVCLENSSTPNHSVRKGTMSWTPDCLPVACGNAPTVGNSTSSPETSKDYVFPENITYTCDQYYHVPNQTAAAPGPPNTTWLVRSNESLNGPDGEDDSCNTEFTPPLGGCGCGMLSSTCTRDYTENACKQLCLSTDGCVGFEISQWGGMMKNKIISSCFQQARGFDFFYIHSTPAPPPPPLVQAFDATCQANGLFGNVLSCEPMPCKPLQTQQNVNVDQTGLVMTFGQQVRKTCKPGYSLDKDAHDLTKYTIKCTAPGESTDLTFTQVGGNGDSFRCVEIDCGAYPNVMSGASTGSTRYMGNIAVTCDEGYSLDGTTAPAMRGYSATCLVNGSFSRVSQCQPIICGLTPNVTHTTNNGGRDIKVYPDVINYEVNTGYTLDPRGAYQSDPTFDCKCHSNGSFSDLPRVYIVQCGQSPERQFASHPNGSHAYGGQEVYSCAEGYTLDGRPPVAGVNKGFTLNCSADGTYVGRSEGCYPVDCGLVTAPENSVQVTDVHHGKKDTLTYSQKAHFDCKPGYSINARMTGPTHLFTTCLINSSISYHPGCKNMDDCEGNLCVANGTCVDHQDPTGVHFDDYHCECNDGWKEKVKPDSRKKYCGDVVDCLPADVCEPGRCQDLVNDYKCHCPEGYNAEANPVENLKEDCMPQSCGKCADHKIPNANCTEKMEFFFDGSPAVYSCDTGYTLDGAADGDASFELLCQADGRLESHPGCLPVACGETPTVQHSDRHDKVENLTFSQKAKYTCDTGYAPLPAKCGEKHGIDYCNEWCNTRGKWGCGIATAPAPAPGDSYTCSCNGCNGCGTEHPEANATKDFDGLCNADGTITGVQQCERIACPWENPCVKYGGVLGHGGSRCCPDTGSCHVTSYTMMLPVGQCKDASNNMFDSATHEGLTVENCGAACTDYEDCLGFDFTTRRGVCQLRFEEGKLPVTKPPGFDLWTRGTGVGDIVQTSYHIGRRCYKKSAEAPPPCTVGGGVPCLVPEDKRGGGLTKGNSSFDQPVAESMVYEDELTIRCNAGFSLTPSDHNDTEYDCKCKADGTIEVPAKSKCKPIDCGPLPTIANARVEGNTTFLGTAKATADKCYSLDGTGYWAAKTFNFQCSKTGDYMGVQTFQKISCGFPPDLGVGVQPVEDETMPITCGDHYEYHLDECFTLDVNGTAGGERKFASECFDSGAFEFVPDVYKITCGAPESKPNADVTQIKKFCGDKALYVCEDGYTLDGQVGGQDQKQVSCKSDGEFETFAGCEPVECEEPVVPENATGTVRRIVFGETIDFTCKPGFSNNGAYGSALTTVTGTCQKDGNISYAGVCINNDDCRSPHNRCSPGGTCKDKDEPTGVIFDDFECECGRGFEPATETKDGIEVRYCKNPDDCPDGACAPGLCIDGLDDYSCNCPLGYVEGPNREEGLSKDCMLDECGYPPEVTNAAINSNKSYLVGESSGYTCNPGHTVEGVPGGSQVFSITCAAHAPQPVAVSYEDDSFLQLGSVRSKPYCVKIVTGTSSHNDGTLDVIVNGKSGAEMKKVTGEDYDKGDTVLNECFTEGFDVLVQNPTTDAWTGTIEISADSGATYSAMVCETCSPAGPADKVVVDGNANAGNQAQVQCFSGQMCLVTSPLAVLKPSFGHHDGCKPVECSAPPAIANGNLETDVSNLKLVFGDGASYGCDRGYIASAGGKSFCSFVQSALDKAADIASGPVDIAKVGTYGVPAKWLDMKLEVKGGKMEDPLTGAPSVKDLELTEEGLLTFKMGICGEAEVVMEFVDSATKTPVDVGEFSVSFLDLDQDAAGSDGQPTVVEGIHACDVEELIATKKMVFSVTDGAEIYLRNPSHGNQYVEAYGHAGGGYGISTSGSKGSAAKFTIHKWYGTGSVTDGDEIYLRNPSHGNQYVEAYGHAGVGYGISTRGSKGSAAKFTIHKWSGTGGAIEYDDNIYLRNPSHGNQYVEASGHAGGGYGISTMGSKGSASRFTVHSWQADSDKAGKLLVNDTGVGCFSVHSAEPKGDTACPTNPLELTADQEKRAASLIFAGTSKVTVTFQTKCSAWQRSQSNVATKERSFTMALESLLTHPASADFTATCGADGNFTGVQACEPMTCPSVTPGDITTQIVPMQACLGGAMSAQKGWHRPFGDVEVSAKGAEECRVKCAEGGYEFFGMECPRKQGNGQTTVHCQCSNGWSGVDVLRPEFCEGKGDYHEHAHCIGPYMAEGYFFGDANVGSVYLTAAAQLETVATYDEMQAASMTYGNPLTVTCQPGYVISQVWDSQVILTSYNITCGASGVLAFPKRCVVPQGWCNGGTFTNDLDHDGDGVPDPHCVKSGRSGFLQSSTECWDNTDHGGYRPLEQCSYSKFGINFCQEWCNTPGKWGCGVPTLPGRDGRNTDNEDYTCLCSGCNGCQPSGLEPVCKPIDCGEPPHIHHAFVSPDSILGRNMTYVAHLGYTTNGSGNGPQTTRSECTPSGEWSVPDAFEKVKCPAFPSVDFGSMDLESYVSIPNQECSETPYTFDAATGCDGWSGLTESECWDKCLASEQAPGCPAKACVAAKWHPSDGWCHLYDSCDSMKRSDASHLFEKGACHVTVWQDADFGGEKLILTTGSWDAGWLGPSWNDRISSIEVSPKCKATFFEYGSFNGHEWTVEDHQRVNCDGRFNDYISSIIVEPIEAVPEEAICTEGVKYEEHGAGNVMLEGNPITGISSVEDCSALCVLNANCTCFSYEKSMDYCYLHKHCETPASNPNCVAGLAGCYTQDADWGDSLLQIGAESHPGRFRSRHAGRFRSRHAEQRKEQRQEKLAAAPAAPRRPSGGSRRTLAVRSVASEHAAAAPVHLAASSARAAAKRFSRVSTARSAARARRATSGRTMQLRRAMQVASMKARRARTQLGAGFHTPTFGEEATYTCATGYRAVHSDDPLWDAGSWSEECADTAGTATARWGYTCEMWDTFPTWCKWAYYYYDDDDFTAENLCCACGGGVKSAAVYPNLGNEFTLECNATGDITTGWACLPVFCLPPQIGDDELYTTSLAKNDDGQRIYQGTLSMSCKKGHTLNGLATGTRRYRETCQDDGQFSRNGTCQKIDYCAGGYNWCGAHGDCVNNVGRYGYHCSCHTGYKVQRINSAHEKCVEIDECQTQRGNQNCAGGGGKGACKDELNGYSCVCFAGNVVSEVEQGREGCSPMTCGSVPTLPLQSSPSEGRKMEYGTSATYTCHPGYSLDKSPTGPTSYRVSCAEVPFAEGTCVDYMKREGCGWTRDWSCPGQQAGAQGHASEQHEGYECCCNQELWKRAFTDVREDKKCEPVSDSMGTMAVDGCAVAAHEQGLGCLYFTHDANGECRCCQNFELRDAEGTTMYQAFGVALRGFDTCKPLFCGDVPEIDNANSTAKNLSFGESATYVCHLGYSVDGTADGRKQFSVSCTASGDLTDPEECKPVSCGEPPSDPFASAPADELFFQDTAIYRCDSGYSVTGNPNENLEYEVQCLASGMLHGFVQCQPNSCGVPNATNFSINWPNYAITYPLEFEIMCQAGYSIDGDALGENHFIMRCGADGLFKGEKECIPVSCGVPEEDDTAASTDPETFFGETARWTCKPGYSTNGLPWGGKNNFTKQCTATGAFGQPAPGPCIDIDYCSSNPCTHNGVCTDEGVGVPACGYTCECADGYETKTGDDGCPTCTVDDCEGDPCGRGTCTDLSKLGGEDGRYSCTCNFGYEVFEPEPQKPKCRQKECIVLSTTAPVNVKMDMIKNIPEVEMLTWLDTPPVMDIGTETPILMAFDLATYTCEEGYSADGTNSPDSRTISITCDEVGILSRPLDHTFKCVKKTCNNLPVNSLDNSQLMNGKLTPWVFGDIAEFQCDAGHTLDGEMGSPTQFGLECLANGSFSTEHTGCQPIACAVPEHQMASPTMSGTILYGQATTYICDPGTAVGGMAANGKAVVQYSGTCEADGSIWAGTERCELVCCGVPPEQPSASLMIASATFASAGQGSCDTDAGVIFEGPAQDQVDCEAKCSGNDECWFYTYQTSVPQCRLTRECPSLTGTGETLVKEPQEFYTMDTGACCCPNWERIDDADQCKFAIEAVGFTGMAVSVQTVNNDSLPGGCSFDSTTYQGVFNEMFSTQGHDGQVQVCIRRTCGDAHLTFDNVVYDRDKANLGNYQHNAALEPVVRYEMIGTYFGQTLDVVLIAPTYPGCPMTKEIRDHVPPQKISFKNGEFGRIPYMHGDSVEVTFEFQDHTTHEPVELSEFDVTFFDVDADPYGRETIIIDGFTQVFEESDPLYEVQDMDGGRLKVTGQATHTGDKNPTTVSSLTQDQRMRSIAFRFLRTSTFKATMGVTGFPQTWARVFMFGFSSAMVTEPPCATYIAPPVPYVPIPSAFEACYGSAPIKVACEEGTFVGGVAGGARDYTLQCSAQGGFMFSTTQQCAEVGFPVNGEITDAQSASQKLSGAKLSFKSVKTGAVMTATADAWGRYSADLGMGTWTATASLEGYIEMTKNITVASEVSIGGFSDFGLSKILGEGQWRVVLDWGAAPPDLDSHIYFGPGGNKHVYYGHRHMYDPDSGITVELDRDDTSSFGPETTTFEGTKHCEGSWDGGTGNSCLIVFKVHNYGGRYQSTKMNKAEGVVTIYKGSSVAAVYRIPECIGPDPLWYTVFTLDAREDQQKLYPGAYLLPPTLRWVPRQGPDYYSVVNVHPGIGESTHYASWIGLQGSELQDNIYGKVMTGMKWHGFQGSHFPMGYVAEVSMRGQPNNYFGTECTEEDLTAGNLSCPAGTFISAIRRRSNGVMFVYPGVYMELFDAYDKIMCCKVKTMSGAASGWGKCEEVAWWNATVETTSSFCPGEHGLTRDGESGKKLMALVELQSVDVSKHMAGSTFTKAKCCELNEDGLVEYNGDGFVDFAHSYPSCPADANSR